MSNILSKLGGTLSAMGNPELAARNQERQQLNRILSGQTIPEFARNEQSSEEIKQAQLKQLGALNSPESLAILSELSPLTRKPQSPLTKIGKLIAERDRLPQGDERRQLFDQAITKATTKDEGININVGGEKGIEARKKKLAENVLKDFSFAQNAGTELASIEMARNNVQKGIFDGPLGGVKTTAIELADSFNLPINKDSIQKAANTRQVEKTFARAVLPELDQLGSNPSDADLSLVREATGSIEQGELSIQDALDIRQAVTEKRAAKGAVLMRPEFENASNTAILREQKKISENFDIKKRIEEIKEQRAAQQVVNEQQGSQQPSGGLESMSTEELMRKLQSAQ